MYKNAAVGLVGAVCLYQPQYVGTRIEYVVVPEP